MWYNTSIGSSVVSEATAPFVVVYIVFILCSAFLTFLNID